jgi:hypothetical protein
MRNPGKFKLRKLQTCMSEGPGGPPKDRKRLKAIERLKIQCTMYCNSGLSFSKLASRGLELIMVAHVTSLQAAAVTKTLCQCFRLITLLSRTFSERRRTSGLATTRELRFARAEPEEAALRHSNDE